MTIYNTRADRPFLQEQVKEERPVLVHEASFRQGLGAQRKVTSQFLPVQPASQLHLGDKRVSWGSDDGHVRRSEVTQ